MSATPLGIRQGPPDDEDGVDLEGADFDSMFGDGTLPGDAPDEGEPTPEPIEQIAGETVEGEANVPAAQPVAEAPAETVEGEEQPALLANKYESVPELERAYGEVQRAFTHVTQDNARMRQEMETQQQQLAEQADWLAQVTQVLQTQMAESDPDFAEELQRRQAIEQQVAQRVEPLQQQIQQQREAEQRQSQTQQHRAASYAAVQRFFAAHPGVEGTPAEDQMAAAMYGLMQAGVAIDTTNPEHIELGYEVLQNPALGAELMMSPNALKVPGGLARIRERAGATIAPNGAAPANGATPPRGPIRQRVDTFVETGSGGAPLDGAPGEAPKDEFDEAVGYYTQTFSKGPLFGSKR